MLADFIEAGRRRGNRRRRIVGALPLLGRGLFDGRIELVEEVLADNVL